MVQSAPHHFFFLSPMRNLLATGALAAILLAPVGAFAADQQVKTCADGTQIEVQNQGYIFGFVQNWFCEYYTAKTFVELLRENPETVYPN